MSDRLSTLAALTAATLIVGGGLYALLKHGAGIVAVAPAPASQPLPAVVAPRASTVRAPQVTIAPPPGGAIYRCQIDGSVVYQSEPCKGGRVVEVQHTQGWEAPRLSVQRQAVQVAEARTHTPAMTSSPDVARAAECALLDQQIAQIDALARAGGTIPYMENLKERRRKLVDRKYEMRC